MEVKTDEELGQALKNNVDTIEIEGSLADKTIRIKATGKVAWGIAIGAVGVAVAATVLIATRARTSGIVTAVTATPVANAFDWAGVAVVVAVIVAVVGGVLGALNKLRKYKLEKHSEGKVVLRRK